MKEYNLQMAWKLSLLAGKALHTTDGDSIEIIFPGYGPSSQGGPDFILAKIKINEAVWIGAVEIHTHSSLWYSHKHDKDEKYRSVILHVVWINDADVRMGEEKIPCLQLSEFMDQLWFDEIEQRIFSAAGIPCGKLMHVVPEIIWQSQLERMFIERLERRVTDVEEMYQQCGKDWDETLYRFVFRFLGKKINNQCMEQLALAVPYRILLKQSFHLLDVEALLMGQAGFLEEDPIDGYSAELKQRFLFLMHKYELNKVYNLYMQWQYKGLRPSGFPELHIARLAFLIHSKGRLIPWAVDTEIEQLQKEQHGIGPYWTTHYRLGKKLSVAYNKKNKWNSLLLINALIPFRIAYKKHTEKLEADLFISLYNDLPAERNRVTVLFEQYNRRAFSARDTQAMLELYNNYCNYKKCLSCKVGHVILKQEGLL